MVRKISKLLILALTVSLLVASLATTISAYYDTYDGSLWGADLIARLSWYSTSVQEASRVEAYPAINKIINIQAKSIVYYTDNTYTRSKSTATYDSSSSTPNYAYANATVSINSNKTVSKIGGYYVFENVTDGRTTSGGLGDKYTDIENY